MIGLLFYYCACSSLIPFSLQATVPGPQAAREFAEMISAGAVKREETTERHRTMRQTRWAQWHSEQMRVFPAEVEAAEPIKSEHIGMESFAMELDA